MSVQRWAEGFRGEWVTYAGHWVRWPCQATSARSEE